MVELHGKQGVFSNYGHADELIRAGDEQLIQYDVRPPQLAEQVLARDADGRAVTQLHQVQGDGETQSVYSQY